MALEWNNVSGIPSSYAGNGLTSLGNSLTGINNIFGNYFDSLGKQRSNQTSADLLSALNSLQDPNQLGSTLSAFNATHDTRYLDPIALQALGQSQKSALDNQNIRQFNEQSQKKFTDTGDLRSNLARVNELIKNNKYDDAYSLYNSSKQKYANTPEYDTIIKEAGVDDPLLNKGQHYADAASALFDANNPHTQDLISTMIAEPDENSRKEIFNKQMINKGYTDEQANDILFNRYINPKTNMHTLTTGQNSAYLAQIGDRLSNNLNQIDTQIKQLNSSTDIPLEQKAQQLQTLQQQKEQLLNSDFRAPVNTSLSNPNDKTGDAPDAPANIIPDQYKTIIDNRLTNLQQQWNANQDPLKQAAIFYKNDEGKPITLTDVMLTPMGKDKVKYEDKVDKVSNYVRESIRKEISKTDPSLAELPNTIIDGIASKNIMQDNTGIMGSLGSWLKSGKTELTNQDWLVPSIKNSANQIIKMGKDYGNTKNIIDAQTRYNNQYEKLQKLKQTADDLKNSQDNIYSTRLNVPTIQDKNGNWIIPPKDTPEYKQYNSKYAQNAYKFNIAHNMFNKLYNDISSSDQNILAEREKQLQAQKSKLDEINTKQYNPPFGLYN